MPKKKQRTPKYQNYTDIDGYRHLKIERYSPQMDKYGHAWYGVEAHCELCGAYHSHGLPVDPDMPRKGQTHRASHCAGVDSKGYILDWDFSEAPPLPNKPP